MSKKIERQNKILAIIPVEPNPGGGISTNVIQERIAASGLGEVTLKTIRDDMQDLFGKYGISGLISDDDPSGAHHWRWQNKASKESAQDRIKAEVAIAVNVAAQYLRGMVPDPSGLFLERYRRFASVHLDDTAQPKLGSWLNKIAVVPALINQPPPKVDEDILETVQTALLNQKKLKLSYEGREGKLSEYIYWPLGLGVRDRTMYLVGWITNEEDDTPDPLHKYYHLALHRFQKAELLKSGFKYPTDFDIKQEVDRGWFQIKKKDDATGKYPRQRFELLLHDHVLPHFKERPPDGYRYLKKGEDPGWHHVEVELFDSLLTLSWLRSFGAKVVVLEPQSVADALRDEFAALQALYAKP